MIYKLLLLGGVFANFISYDGFKVLRIHCHSAKAANRAREVLEQMDSVNLWSPETFEQIEATKSVDVSLSARDSRAIMSRLAEKADYSIQVLIDNVGELMDEPVGVDSDLPLNQYLTFDAAEKWLNTIADEHPQFAHLETIGQTVQGRTMWGLHLGYGNHSDDKKKIFIECGFHAREWIAPASCRYFIHSLLTAASGQNIAVDLPYTDEDLKSLLDFNWYIIPYANPDGYHWTQVADRMWRKNRAEIDSARGCVGVDLNRNFPIGFHTGMGTELECMITYGGEEPINQPETIAWDTWFKKIRSFGGGEIAAQISVHCYSQLLMPPWATGREIFPDDPPTIDYLMNVTTRMNENIFKTHGSIYEIGQSRDVVGYAAGGTTEDYAFDAENGLGVPLAWVYELRDQGKYGFLLPSHQIVPTGEEVINSFMALAEELRNPTGPN